MRIRRLFSLVLVVALMLCVTPVRAYAVNDDWNWSDSINDYVIVPWTDLVVDVVDAFDRIGDSVTDFVGENFRDVVDFWGGLFSPGAEQSYDDYVAGIEEDYGVTGFGSDGLLYWTPPYSLATLSTISFTAYRHYHDMVGFDSRVFSDGISASCSIGNNVILSGYHIDGNFIGLDHATIMGEFSAPIDGSYTTFLGNSVDGHSYKLYGSSSLSNEFFSSGDSLGIYCYCQDEFSVESFSYVFPQITYRIIPRTQGALPSSTTRPVYFTQQVYNYNNVDAGTTKYGIGVVDDSGDITNVFDVNLFDEETMVFSEPVTENQYLCTKWTYDYNTRTYRLSLEPGTFLIGEADIDQIDLTYGDEELTISYWSSRTLVRTDTFAYVIATPESEGCQHEFVSDITVEPTCELPGEVVYTCSICGYQYTDEVELLGHDWKLIGLYEAEFDDEGNVTEYAYNLYECSRCKEQYKDYDDTGPPTEDDSWLPWLGSLFRSLISAIVNGLASGLEYLVNTVIVTVVDLAIQVTSWVFDFFNVEHLTTWFTWFSDGNSVFQDEFGQDTEETEVDVWAYS